MKSLATLVTGSALSLFAASASAQEITCGGEYTVVAGDYLSSIAQRAYGNLSAFSTIYNANVDVIGPNPGIIRIGQKLQIPCLDEPGPAVIATDDAETPESEDGEGERLIRLLSSSGWRPFLDETDPQGGLLTEIVELALVSMGGQESYEIDFVNDPGAHLDTLITKGDFDVSIGQLQPDCDASGLGTESTYLCEEFTFSQPLYEEVFGYYSDVSDPEYTDHQQLIGKSICRAADFSLVPLEAVNLAEPDITIVRAPDAASCVDFVLANRADVALVAIEVADARLKQLDATRELQVHEALSYVDFFHATVANDNSRRDQIMATLNEGLASIKASGLWFQTVRRHMSEFRKATD